MLIIGIAGGTGSGKTSVALSIIENLGSDNVTFISQDNYYKDHIHLSKREREQVNYDHPLAIDNELLLAQLNLLQQGIPVSSPIYDFSNHTRSSETVLIEAKPVLIVEGFHVLTEESLRSLLDIKVFVDTDSDIRILRRLTRDINERGRTIQSVIDQYISTVKPMHEAFIEPSKKYADIIIPEGAHNEVGINLLTSLTEKYMMK